MSPATGKNGYVAALLLLLLCSVPTGTDAFEIWFPHVSREAGFSDDTGPMALINFGAQGAIPRFNSLTTLLFGAYMVAYWYKEGIFATVFYYVLLQAFFLMTFVFFAISTDTDATVWNYGFLNHEPLLTNRGAIGVDFVSLGYWAAVLMGATLGHTASLVKVDVSYANENMGDGTASNTALPSYKADTLFNYFSGIMCARFLCPASVVGVKEGQKTPRPFTRPIAGTDPSTRAGQGKDDSTVVNALTANMPGAERTWAVYADHTLMFILIGVTSGPMGDLFDNAWFMWLGFGSFNVAMVLIFCLFQFYKYSERTALSTDPAMAKREMKQYAGDDISEDWENWVIGQNATRIYNRFYNKQELLYIPWIHLDLYYGGMLVYWSIMAGENAFRRINFAHSVEEARRFAKENLLLELFCMFICWAALMITAIITYYYIMRCYGNRRNGSKVV